MRLVHCMYVYIKLGMCFCLQKLKTFFLNMNTKCIRSQGKLVEIFAQTTMYIILQIETKTYNRQK